MPIKSFIEEYPLYRKFKINNLPQTADRLSKPRINMICTICKSNQTFVMDNECWENYRYTNPPIMGIVFRMHYLCVQCQKFERSFFIKVDENLQWLMKVGQFPSWEIKGDSNLEKMLGNHFEFFKKGLVCESQGYGIGAFGYYRRIVEEIIDNLLNEIGDLLTDQELVQYEEALKKTKETIVAQEKIELVKDLLPPILRPNGMNPLSTLHSTLSEGLHSKLDEECLEYSETCREILKFLVNQVSASKEASKGFTESMRKLLEKKAKKSS